MNFPQEIKNFSVLFRNLQAKRHQADYDPYAQFFKSDVRNDLFAARRVIRRFDKASMKDRRAFAALVLLKAKS